MRSMPADPLGLGAGRAPGWWLHEALLLACAQIGVEAWPLPPPMGLEFDDTRSRIAVLDGLILGGGGDLAVDGMGCRAAELPLRDRHEYGLLDAALARGIPVLGICRGAQLLQLAAGGAIEAPADGPDAPSLHCDRRIYLAQRHPIELAEGGVLAGLAVNRELAANSAHRWTIRELAPGMRVEAICPVDGTIEAFSSVERRLLGTLWHPEFDFDDPDALPGRQVFEAFVGLMKSSGTAAALR